MSATKRLFLLLAALYGLAGAATGVIQPADTTQGLLGHALSIVVIVAIYVWCRSDLRRRLPVRSSRWAVWSALMPLPVLSLYLFRTRPPRRAFMSIAKAVGAYAALVLVFTLLAAVAAAAIGN